MLNPEKFTGFAEHRRIGLYTLRNPNGLVAQLTNYGAKIVSLYVPAADGSRRDVVLGFNTLEEWQTKETYFNAIIGRVANRIKDGRFTLEGKQYQLATNNGTNHLHGGNCGFNEHVWDVVGQTAYSISFHYHSKDGEESYPGNVDVFVTYRLTRDNALEITYEGKTDKTTLLALTNHAYFNLSGEGTPSVNDHTLQVFADQYTPFDDTACPVGEIHDVEGTPMDFREPVRIGDRISLDFFKPGRGIDNNFILRKTEKKKKPELAAVLSDGGLTMQVLTTMPALQVYTGNYVEENIGKSGKQYREQCAVCLEAQSVPNAVNQKEYPSVILKPNEIYFEQTIYKFV